MNNRNVGEGVDNRVIDKVGLAIITDGKLLLARNRGSDVYQIPGGKVEPQDTDDFAALSREIMEELQIPLIKHTLQYIGEFSDEAAGQPGLVVKVKLYTTTLDKKPVAANEVEELRWFSLGASQLPGNLSAVVRRKIIPYLVEHRIA